MTKVPSDPLPKSRSRSRSNAADCSDLHAQLSRRVVGQPAAMTAIAPYIALHQSGLAPEGRPLGIFLLLGPTGTGKTRTVEALAEVLHGSPRNVLRIDCGEFQMDHEVAKLIGAPPGYLGHRETQPLLSQSKVNSVASERSGISIILFDEIEKAAPSLQRLLLGILDKATLRLGDNNTVLFERCLIFLTSNLGAHSMMKELAPALGFQGAAPDESHQATRLDQLATNAARRHFSPEFVNRLDAVLTYQPLTEQSLKSILEIELDRLQHHIRTRLGERGFELCIAPRSKAFLLQEGTSTQYGARELKRTIHRHLTQPLAALVASGRVRPGGRVVVSIVEAERKLLLRSL
jgi:ATP-dependent Clp protease ATP-binding subunit ClpA